ncbi:uncharacterized protein LOC100197876 isoform X1 [Hydra vulgaris]|uniref:uncharacterized protein LOC100197876 isoform X1 n=2 Tax=Hydra vulgaris TaxID=6087 RepID=UPI0002B40DF8|nr:uncharacterized protein LOC100197876 isoform X1 [Hydra vulgaris]
MFYFIWSNKFWITKFSLLLGLLSVKFVTGNLSLRISPPSKLTQQSKVAANFPFDPPIIIQVLRNGALLTTGPDSSLEVKAAINDSSKCLSADATFSLKNGSGIFPGSICEVTTAPLTLSFSAVSSQGVLTSDSTNAFVVVGEIHLALFHQDRRYLNGRYEEFLRDNIDTINTGKYNYPTRMVFPGRTLYMKSYYYPDNIPESALKAFFQMQDYHQKYPEKKAYGIIGFNDNDLSKTIYPFAMMNKYAVTTYREDTLTEFNDKNKYPYLNRIGYDDNIMYHGLLVYLKERKWNKIIIIQSVLTSFRSEFYIEALRLGIEVVAKYVISDVTDLDSEPYGKLNDMYTSVKASGIRLIVTPAKGDTSVLIYTEAIRASVTCTDGYQWVGYQNADDFPSSNSPPYCHIDKNSLCVLRFKGMTFNSPMYLVDGWDTPEWNMIWNKWLEGDVDKSLGQTRDFPLEDPGSFGSIFALARDCLSTKILAMERLIASNLTINGETLSTEILKNTDFHGLTGQVTLDPETGERINYVARVSQLWPNTNYYSITYMEQIIRFGYIAWWDWSLMPSLNTHTLYNIKNTNTTTVVEMKTEGGQLALQRALYFNDLNLLVGYIEVDQKFKNKRSFKAYQGFFSYTYQKQVKMVLDPYADPVYIDNVVEDRIEYVPAPYYCNNTCGGSVLDPSDINVFQNGKCILQDVCSCNMDAAGQILWSGVNCQFPVCHAGCKQGVCTAPNQCDCFEGYSGEDCVTPICSSCSSGGICVSPELCVCNPGHFGSACEQKCTCVNGICHDGVAGDGTCSKCNPGYTGANCNISLVALILPLIIGLVLSGLGIFFLARFLIKRAKDKAALYNNDWIVTWSDIKHYDEATGRSNMHMSALSMDKSAARKKINSGSWQGIDVHYQKIDKETISLTDTIRLEVKHMRDISHINIANFLGCVIEAPNISILMEFQPKGSLDDIMSNEDIKVPWNFRFAFIKGILKGLQYLHNSEIKSHGRLKSSNILVDNRWTVKLTGFGLHSFKSNQKGVGVFNPLEINKNIDQSTANYFSLLWTSPEILKTGVYHLNHVGRGSVEGDIYSLGMVLSEMCSRSFPFADLDLEKADVIRLICGQKDDDLLKAWKDYVSKSNAEAGGFVRPCIKDTEWPAKYEKRKALKKLMEACWHEDPTLRPSIKECIVQVDRIDPQKGELMDNLVTMLEKYSNNLENIVTKRTKQLAIEKQKTEDLVSRLLPKSVAEDLKQGKRVEPETFDFVTIYFSDIVGFTSIAKRSTPMEVVALLNDMYTCFDSIAANYDVYKVETIGDAYMIVSGLPNRNGDLHAGEICTTALDLMYAVGNFKIAHLPDTGLHLRAGIHTGMVVSGVVGLKMPRYCLFGDTVASASKMESSGSPMRIQISDYTYQILLRLKGYRCEFRHEYELKGKGMVKTYWLIGKDGYDKIMPDWTQFEPEPGH